MKHLTRWEMHKKIIDKALRDESFKKKLLSHPKETVKELFHKEEIAPDVWKQIHVKVVEEKKNEWVIPLPNYVNYGQQLSKEELHNLSAGGCWSWNM